MTTMFEPFFGVPQAVIRSGKVKKMSGSALKLYVALWHESEYSCSRELELTFEQLGDLIGGVPNSHIKARRELVQAGLIKAEPAGQKGYLFLMCDPKTGEPWPEHPQERHRYRPKGVPINVEVPDVTSPMKRKPPKMANAGTEFPFGANIEKVASPVPTVIEEPPMLSTPLTWNEVGTGTESKSTRW